ncbi:hypothetical protein ABZ319_08425 [Nocardia sp. NPDC005978]|uniref:hypothetical protein n=1 Tax=Nocardia sp. NPDC005978 TaxID=3156725 RepID=UPI0033A33588
MRHDLHGLAENPALPADLLDRLIATADSDLAEVLARRSDLTGTQVAALARFERAAARLGREGRLTEFDQPPRPRVALALLEAGFGRPEWARVLAADPSARTRERLAACPALPRDVTHTLASDPDVMVVAELALWATSDVAAQLATHPHAEVRRAVATNEATPGPVLAALLTGDQLPPARSCGVCDLEAIPFVHDPNCQRPDCALMPGAACDGSHESTVYTIQQMALRNPATPADAVVAFADRCPGLHNGELAARTDLPRRLYAELAGDPVPLVRAQLADNPAIDENLIRALAFDRGHDVQRRLAHHPHLPLDILAALAAGTRIGPTLLPRIASATTAEAEELAASTNPILRMLVAQRRDLPAGLRDALARDADAKVLASIAPHPGLSETRLRELAAAHGARVSAAVTANPDATASLLEELARQRPSVLKALREIARHPHATAAALRTCLTDSRARRSAAGHRALPPATIVELLDDQDWQVVQAAAANPALPHAAMYGLVS